jgi:hypothetical protein
MLGLLGLGLLVLGCTEPVDDPRCALNIDCVAGTLCTPEGTCVEGLPVEIQTSPQPPPAYLGEAYSHLAQLQGGLPPFAWRLETSAPELAWLTVEPETGELRPKQGLLPEVEGRGLGFSLFVRDRSNAGQGLEVSRDFTLDVRACRAEVFCYQPEPPACRQGTRACVDGHLAEECVLGGLSNLVAHCGPACAACPSPGANSCNLGQCSCGTGPVCAPGESCCGGACALLESDPLHCGACGLRCAERVENVVTALCRSGTCDYDACLPGFHDCDGNRENGCETARDLTNCAFCGDDCEDEEVYLRTTGHVCGQTGCEYTCEAGYASCDGDAGNGCETDLSLPATCGACGRNCATHPGGFVCLPGGTPGEFACGCATEGDCAQSPEPQLCCGGTCRPIGDSDCGACGRACTIGEGGLSCVFRNDAWGCECEDNQTHLDCKGQFLFSYALCSSIIHSCYCGTTTTNCEGTEGDMCCDAAPQPACTSLLVDAQNCGMCGKSCTGGGACVSGACTCPGGTCPPGGNAPSCVNGNCACFQFDGAPCPVGQYCCNNPGNAVGCCLQACTVSYAQGNECSANCGAPKTWCSSGCCDSCDPDTGCE